MDTTRQQTVAALGTGAVWTTIDPLQDRKPIKKLYGDNSSIGLNIISSEVCCNLNGTTGGICLMEIGLSGVEVSGMDCFYASSQMHNLCGRSITGQHTKGVYIKYCNKNAVM